MDWILLLPVLVPVCGAVCLLAFGSRFGKKTAEAITLFCVFAAGISVLVISQNNGLSLTVLPLLPELPVYFRPDGVSHVFAGITAFMWFLSTWFSFGYLKEDERETKYQMFSLLSLGALLGVCYSGNLITTYLFYEMMTLVTFPLVLHERTKEAVSAGLTYLYYSVAGAFLGLCGIFFLYANAMDGDRPGGKLAYLEGGFLKAGASKSVLLPVICLMLVGLACKAGMFPLHGWLPKAHPVAPSPASALLSGNITKMGILFTVRVIFYSVGQEFLQETWVMDVLLCLSLFTVFMGSMLAFREKLLKKRLAYSTVSQTSYCLTGIYLLSGTALTGALMHVVFHSVIKNLLFLCAGAIIVQTGKKSVSELKGIGRIMPATMRCFTVAGLALVGIPPLSGFISKWYLAEGAIESGLPGFMYLVPVVLLISALLTAGYLLTISADAFFGKTEEETARCPKSMYLLPPLIIGAILAVVLGIFPNPLTDFLERIVAGLF
ncbi:MAG: proton-conducting membrane transporter [Lachnospiraceae bacterium]|nr:proton-conducting membrane transporter [Lachnospiraceae bacterium]